MKEYLVTKICKQGQRITVIPLDKSDTAKAKGKGRHHYCIAGNFPALYPQMTLQFEIQNMTMTDYHLELTERNKGILQKHHIAESIYAETLAHHMKLKQDGFTWEDAKIGTDKVYDKFEFYRADRIHKNLVNNATDELRLNAINKNVIQTGRQHRKICYSLNEFFGYFNYVEEQGSYDKLIMPLKAICLQAECYGVRNNMVFDTEMKEKEDFVMQNIMERVRNGNYYQLLTTWEIDNFIRSKQSSYLADEQLNVMNCLYSSVPCIVTGGAGCVDCDTEFFDGHSWKKIADFKCGDKVLQYNEDGTASLVYPLNYIKKKCNSMWHFETKRLDQCLTDEHTVVYESRKTGKLKKISFKEMREKHEKSGFGDNFITSFCFSGKGIDLTEAEIRMMTAVFADGTFVYKNCSDDIYRKCRFHLKKGRKKERLESLIALGNFEYTKKESTAEGYTDYYVIVPFRAKHFPKEWYECSKEQFKAIADEIVNWDCDYTEKNRFSTTSMEDADFIQFVMTALGKRTVIYENDRSDKEHFTCGKVYKRKSKEYTVSWSDVNRTALCRDKREDHTKTEIVPYQTKDGFKYCFTVYSNMLVLRRNGKIFITGNCGKTTVIKSLIECYGKYYGTSYILLAAPTGKASRRLAEKTGMPACTIHKALRKSLTDDFTYYNEKNPLPHRLIIVDESSMIDTSLMYDLLKATDKAAKLVFVGDHNQLYPVGYGEPFFQFMDVMEIYRLEQNHRQSEDTDILYMANHVLQNLPVTNGSGVSVKEIEYSDIPKVLDWYLCGNGYDENSQVISPFNMTNYDINCYAQEQNARKNGFLKQDELYFSSRLYVGDKVMTVRNTEHYCNGDIGIVSSVNEKEITVQIEGRQVVIPAKDKEDIMLAYAITVHKMQGSEADRIIVFLPKESKMVEKRMLYTAFTRAKKELLIYYY